MQLTLKNRTRRLPRHQPDSYVPAARQSILRGTLSVRETQRLVSEVLTPVRLRQPGHFHRFDWAKGTLGEAEPVPETDVLIVDLIGLFHPEALPSIDITVWCDVDLDTAEERGIARDRQLGRNHEALWREVWTPNERDFAMLYAPRSRADVLYEESP
jgi:hypothetical protein